MIYTDLGIGCSGGFDCESEDGCPKEKKPDFCIKRNDTAPSFKVGIEDCEGIVNLDGNYSLEVNIWIKSKLKKSISATETEIQFADNIGFQQVKQNNLLVMSRPRSFEKMLIVDFNENEKKIIVERGKDGTAPQSWEKGSELIVFRAVGAEGQIELIYEDVDKEDGTKENELVQTFLVYNFTQEVSSLSGCYWLEYKLLEFDDNSNILSTRKFPLEGEGFLVKVVNSPTGD